MLNYPCEFHGVKTLISSLVDTGCVTRNLLADFEVRFWSRPVLSMAFAWRSAEFEEKD